MNKSLFFLLLFSFSTSAFALFPIENDWTKHHLQGKVKSIKSKEEGNSAQFATISMMLKIEYWKFRMII